MAEMMIEWPYFPAFGSNTYGTAHRLDATTKEFAIVMYAQEDATITEIGWVQSSISASTPGTLRIGLQGVTTTGGTPATAGIPNGTWLASGNGYGDKTTWSSGDNGTYVSTTLGTSVSLTRGQCFAIVLKPQAVGTWGASNWADIGYFINVDGSLIAPYVVLDGTKSTSSRFANTIVRSSTKTFGIPYETIATSNIQTTASPSQLGIKFSIPAGVCDTYQICGVSVFMDTSGTSSFDIKLYEGTNRTALQSLTVDSDQTGTQSGFGKLDFYFANSTLSTLTAGTTYRIMIEAGSSTTAGTFRYITLDKAQDMTAYVGSAATYQWTQWGGSSYTDIDTQFPMIQPIICDMTEPSGGSTAANPLAGYIL